MSENLPLHLLRQTPSFQEWEQEIPSAKGNVRFFQQLKLSVDTTLCLLDVLFPLFIEEEGLILRERKVDKSRVLEQLQGGEINKSQAELILNRLRVHELFAHDPDADRIDPLDETLFIYVASKIALCWSVHLREQFPQKKFKVDVGGKHSNP